MAASLPRPTNGNQPAIVAAPIESKAKRVNPIKRKQMEDRLVEAEREIAKKEATVAEIELHLQTFVSAEETQRLSGDLSRLKNDLQNLMKEWEELSEALA